MSVPEKDSLELSSWRGEQTPKRILVIRLQAHGDVIALLPYARGLAEALPDAQVDLLTREEFTAIPQLAGVFNKVIGMRGRRNDLAQRAGAVAAWLFTLGRYDAVLDLQRNHISRWIRKRVRPAAWSEFDRFAAKPVGERYADAVRNLGVTDGQPSWIDGFDVDDALLRDAGWNGEDALVVLNPAGYWPTRNWPIENYVALARMWLEQKNPNTKFLLLGIDRMQDAAKHIERGLEESCLNLVGKTRSAEAFALLPKASVVIGEDSGLLHMAWVQDRPNVTLFGSTNSVWARPSNPRSYVFTSEDLPCGCCMKDVCGRGDLFCLVRRTPEEVFEKAAALVGDDS